MIWRWAVVLTCCGTLAAAAERWNVQYFYDEQQTELELTDLAFPSAQRGIAIGSIYERNGKGRPKYTAVVTSDGGANWSLVPLREYPRSIFFLNDSIGWMVTMNGVWFTEESGRSWKKICEQIKADKTIEPHPPGGLLLRVWFLTPEHGFGVGLQKSVVETKDGGRTWSPVEEALKPSANPAFSAYTHIAFNDSQHGVIIGGSSPPRREDLNRPSLPAWADPERATKRRQVPNLTLMLQTTDGGTTWKSSTAPLFGALTSVKYLDRIGITIFGFNDGFEWPSEVFRMRSGETTRIFREKTVRVMDSLLFPGPVAILAGVEPIGKLNSAPIPSKVKILRSADFELWTPMEVSYKANARSLVLAGTDPEHMWAATDTGMILHLSVSR
jgi:hypothetical protein